MQRCDVRCGAYASSTPARGTLLWLMTTTCAHRSGGSAEHRCSRCARVCMRARARAFVCVDAWRCVCVRVRVCVRARARVCVCVVHLSGKHHDQKKQPDSPPGLTPPVTSPCVGGKACFVPRGDAPTVPVATLTRRSACHGCAGAALMSARVLWAVKSVRTFARVGCSEGSGCASAGPIPSQPALAPPSQRYHLPPLHPRTLARYPARPLARDSVWHETSRRSEDGVVQAPMRRQRTVSDSHRVAMRRNNLRD